MNYKITDNITVVDWRHGSQQRPNDIMGVKREHPESWIKPEPGICDLRLLNNLVFY